MPQIAFFKTGEFAGHRSAVYTLCPSPREGHFFSAGSEGLLAEWNQHTGEGKAFASVQSPVFSITSVKERNLLVLGLQDGGIHFLDAGSHKVIRSVKLHEAPVFELLTLDNNRMLAAAGDGSVSVWELENFGHIHFQHLSSKSIRTVARHPVKNNFAIGSSDHSIRIADENWQVTKEWDAHRLPVFRLAWSPDGKYLLSTGRDAQLSLWNSMQEFACEKTVPAHLYAVNDLVFHPSGKYFFSASMDKSIKLWSFPEMELLKVVSYEKYQVHKNGVNRLLWLGNSLLSCGDDGAIIQWETGPTSA